MRRNLSIGEKTEVSLHAKVKRNPSDDDAMLQVHSGEKYHISLIKIISPWRDWFRPSPFHGFHKAFMYWIVKPRIPKANYYCVCGGVGDDDAHLFVIFENALDVQNGKQIEIKKDGQLFFFANDAKWFYWNNHGEILLEIRREG